MSNTRGDVTFYREERLEVALFGFGEGQDVVQLLTALRLQVGGTNVLTDEARDVT